MITVIIPTLNEQTTISHVVQLVRKVPSVTEILVIDDKSCDNTIKNVKSEKVKIYTSTKLGKGASMRDGMLLASAIAAVISRILFQGQLFINNKPMAFKCYSILCFNGRSCRTIFSSNNTTIS